MLNGNLATRAAIAALQADTVRVEARVEAAKSDLSKWVIGALTARGGPIVALAKLH